jgi:DNA repair protein RadC
MTQIQNPQYREWEHTIFAETGIEAMEPLEVLEMLLSYSTPHMEPYPLACRIIEQFQGFVNVMNADYDVLLDTPGISKRTAALIRLSAEMHRYVRIEKEKCRVLNSKEDVIEYLRPYFLGLNRERAYMLSMSSNGRAIAVKMTAKGNHKRVNFSISSFAKEAMRTGAAKVVVAHNHLCADAVPSPADLVTTGRIIKALAALDIKLTDHIIFGDNSEYSLRESGLVRGW